MDKATTKDKTRQDKTRQDKTRQGRTQSIIIDSYTQGRPCLIIKRAGKFSMGILIG
jgi:hypothetical protein